MLAAQTAGDLGSQPAEDFVRRINDEPVPFDLVRLGGKGFHEDSL
jgi:hypothetical protein